jgi:hypothetical protein
VTVAKAIPVGLFPTAKALASSNPGVATETEALL